MAELTQSHCPYCSLQCGIHLTARADGVLDLVGREDFPVNRGGLCMKGASAAELIHHPDRLTTPLARARRSRPLEPVGWDEALDRVATAIRTAQSGHGRDAVGCFGGGGLTNEKAYQLGKFARVALGTAMVDYNGRFCMSSAAAAANRAFGIDRGLPFPLSDVAEADVIVLVGSNPADTMPPAMQWFEAGRERGARHIVIDPRLTSTAKLADRHLQPVPGTDLALANGLLHIAIRDGLVDEPYIAARTTGFDAVRRAVRSDWPDRITSQPLYFRGGNASDELVTVVLARDGQPMRYFPIGAKGAVHVALAVVEDIEEGTVLELQFAAPDRLTGTVVVDLGLVEV